MINNLSLELENETNSNMVVANDAVYKISQLQEEKALLRMECSQYNEIEDLNLQLTRIKNMEFSSKLDVMKEVLNDDVVLNDLYDVKMMLVVVLVWGVVFYCLGAGGEWSNTASSRNQDEVMPGLTEEGEEELYSFLDYRRDGDHRPPVSRKPKAGPINNIKRPSWL
ncbi:hypothetical protein L7F22_058548 [Adiantum nelumboides]|nr:hypothetical protein [Adiantum nelumboides]